MNKPIDNSIPANENNKINDMKNANQLCKPKSEQLMYQPAD